MVAKHRFTVAQYDRMIETGILREDDRVELLRGEVVPKMPCGPRHAAVIKRLIRLVTPQVLGRAILDAQNPIRLPDSEPEPDLAVLRPSPDDYESDHPSAADVLALVEVADSSLRRDRTKLARYAWANVPVAWIVNLNDKVVEVCTRPTGLTHPARYQDVTVYGESDEVREAG